MKHFASFVRIFTNEKWKFEARCQSRARRNGSTLCPSQKSPAPHASPVPSHTARNCVSNHTHATMSAQKLAASASRQINAVVVSAGLMQKTVKVRVGVQKWN